MDQLFSQFTTLLGAGRVSQNESLVSYSSFRSGGEASLFVQVETITELQKVVQLCIEAKISYRIIGSGTLTIFSQKGFTGVIIKNNARRFEVMTMTGKIYQQHLTVATALLYAESGANVTQVVRYSLEQSLSGLEYQLGLPGTIGGALYSNAQYTPKHKHIGEHVKSARILTKEGEVQEVDASYFAFAFDYSALQKNGHTLLSVVFELTPGNKTQLWERGQEASAYRSTDQPQTQAYTYRNMLVLSSDEELIIQPDMSAVLQKADIASMELQGVKLSEKRYNYLIKTGEADSDAFNSFIQELKKNIKTKTGAEVEIKTYMIGD